MTPLIFILAALATFRLALMFSSESGPAAIFARLRRSAPSKSNIGEGLRCSKCWSVWIAAIITAWLVYCELVPLRLSPIYALAVSGASVFIHVWQAE